MAIWEESETHDASNASEVVRACDSAVLHDAVLAAVGCGWLLSIGGSRDGYSVSLGVIVDGKAERKWHTAASTFEEALQAVVRAGDRVTEGKAPGTPSKPAGGRRAPRR